MMWPAQLFTKASFTPEWLKPCSGQGSPLFWASHLPTAMAAADFCCSIQNYGRKWHDLLKDPPGSGFLSDYHIPQVALGLQSPKKCDNPQNTRPRVSNQWQKLQRCMNNELSFPRALGSGMDPGSQLMPSAGSSAEITSLLSPLPAQRHATRSSPNTPHRVFAD